MAWILSGAEVDVLAYAKRYGVDHNTAYRELTELDFPVPTTAAKRAQRRPAVQRKVKRRIEKLDDEGFADPDWIWVGDQRMLVVGYTPGGAPFGPYEDEIGCGSSAVM